MSVSFWITLGVSVATFIGVWLFDHGEAYRQFKTSAGRERRSKRLRFILLWAIPTLTIVATVFAGCESVSSDERLTHVSSRLTNTQSELWESKRQLQESIAKVDPRKQPIAMISAFVNFTIRGRVQTMKFHTGDGFGPVYFHLGRHSEAKSNKWAVSLESGKVWFGGNDDSSHCSIEFKMNSLKGLWNAKSMTTGEIEELDVMQVITAFLPGDCEILGGSGTVTYNAVITKEYPIMPQKSGGPAAIIVSILSEVER